MRGVEFYACLDLGEDVEDIERLKQEWVEATKQCTASDEAQFPSMKSKEAEEAPRNSLGR